MSTKFTVVSLRNVALSLFVAGTLSACLFGNNKNFDSSTSGNAGTGGATRPVPVYDLGTGSVSGIITSRTNLPSLPAGSKVVVSIQDITVPGAPATELARQEIANASRFPIPFKVDYKIGNVLLSNQYNIAVRVEKNNIITYWNDQYSGVITRGTGSNHNRVVSLVPTGYKCDECKFTN